MKIYFEDGPLEDVSQLPFKPNLIISADDGISSNFNALDFEMHRKCDGVITDDYVIYTNSIAAFRNQYAWNEQLQVPEIYIRAGENQSFTRIDELTERVLREGHNLAHLYVAGEFN